jgi:hypothetical protein
MTDDRTHVDAVEAADANDPAVGDGTPEDAPERVADDWGVMAEAKWRPTRKWVVARTAALGVIALSAIGTGWDNVESAMLVTTVVEGIASYLTPEASE